MPARWPGFDEEKAGSTQQSKAARGAHMLADYERPGKIVHVAGYHEVLERALRRFPLTKPFDLVDASYYGWLDLSGKRRRKGKPMRQAATMHLPVAVHR